MALTSPDQENVNNTALIVLQGIATGSLLYVVFFEILEKERQKAVPGLLQVIAMSLGFIFMVLLGLAEVKGGSRDGGTAASSVILREDLL